MGRAAGGRTIPSTRPTCARTPCVTGRRPCTHRCRRRNPASGTSPPGQLRRGVSPGAGCVREVPKKPAGTPFAPPRSVAFAGRLPTGGDGEEAARPRRPRAEEALRGASFPKRYAGLWGRTHLLNSAGWPVYTLPLVGVAADSSAARWLSCVLKGVVRCAEQRREARSKHRGGTRQSSGAPPPSDGGGRSQARRGPNAA